MVLLPLLTRLLTTVDSPRRVNDVKAFTHKGAQRGIIRSTTQMTRMRFSLQRNAQISHAPRLANRVRLVCEASVDRDRLLKLQSDSKTPNPFLCFAMITLALNIRLLSSVPSLTFANTLALIPFPKWIGPYMV
jgi:hypothetical protein